MESHISINRHCNKVEKWFNGIGALATASSPASISGVSQVEMERDAVPIYQPAPYDYTSQAWFACLCCFWPAGVLAIMKATESREALARGDLAHAQSAASSARTMVRISFLVGILSLLVLIAIIGVIFGVLWPMWEKLIRGLN